MIRVGINGYGRIGRDFHRQVLKRDDIQVVAVNSRADAASHVLLLKYDSIYGILDADIKVVGNDFSVNGNVVKVFQEAKQENVPWGSLDVDVVIEATGRFTTRETTEPHLKAGAKKVLVTAPCSDPTIQTIVMGVNHLEHDPKKYDILSNASCTTNALAPTMKVLEETFGIESAIVTTIHAFTYTQNLLDNSNPEDMRRARATTQSIIPTTTGAMAAIWKVIPSLKGKVDGMAFRVPVATVSVLDLKVDLNRDVSVGELNKAFLKAEAEGLAGILATSNEPLVSIDYSGNTHSATVDLLSTKVVLGRKAQLIVWYDNEWGYVARIIDFINWMMS